MQVERAALEAAVPTLAAPCKVASPASPWIPGLKALQADPSTLAVALYVVAVLAALVADFAAVAFAAAAADLVAVAAASAIATLVGQSTADVHSSREFHDPGASPQLHLVRAQSATRSAWPLARCQFYPNRCHHLVVMVGMVALA